MKIDKIVEKFRYKRQIVYGDIVDNPLRDIKEGNLRWGTPGKAAEWNASDRVMFVSTHSKYYTFYAVPDKGTNFYVKKKVWEAAYRSTLPVRLLSNV